MIRHRLLCLGYFDFGSVGLFNLGFLSLFSAYAQQSQNAAQSSQPTDVVAAVTGLRTLGGVVISWLIGVIITAACIVGVAAVGELVDTVFSLRLAPQTVHFSCLMPVASLVAALSITHWKLCAVVSALSPHLHSC